MNGNELFAQLAQRLQSYADAAVLWICLKEHADVEEISITAGKMATIELCDTMKIWDVQRTIKRLELLGFISVRIHKNTRTLVTVHREAVLNLLRQPMPERLPALSKKVFPFLAAWNEDLAAQQAAQQAIDDAKANLDGSSGQTPEAG